MNAPRAAPGGFLHETNTFEGALAHGGEESWTVVPILWCTTSPSAHVMEHAFERIAGRLLYLLAAEPEFRGTVYEPDEAIAPGGPAFEPPA